MEVKKNIRTIRETRTNFFPDKPRTRRTTYSAISVLDEHRTRSKKMFTEKLFTNLSEKPLKSLEKFPKY